MAVKGDFSRLTFAAINHYRRVLMQQGRVEIDADGNEQIAIDDHIAETTSTDVIGQAGYPAGAAGGFALGLTASGTDLTISTGRMYVDGLLVENDTPGATLLGQPDMPSATLAELGAKDSGVYLAYLDVWERLVTALDDPRIRESALGGPDTSVRTRLVWQVKLTFLGATPGPGGTLPTCSGAGEPWPAASTGMLAAGTAPPGGSQPCSLPPETGYQRLENQLYRVEIHVPGADGTATFKWSRENGSVAALISSPPGGTGPTAAGPNFWVTSLSADPSLGLRAGDWVELSDDHDELITGHGTLYQVSSTPTDGHTVTLSPTPPPVTLALHPKLRRWDQRGSGLSAGVPVTTGAPIPLEGGVQVEFSGGTYRAGDHWVFPARTATSIQQGYVGWPVDASSAPVPEPPHGIVHHYARLGLVELTAAGTKSTFSGLGTATSPTDCRLPFPPLTALSPAQSLSPCTFVVTPGPGWEQPIISYFEHPPAPPPGGGPVRLDAEICFPVGDFPVRSPLVISNAGHIRVNGAGWGTRVLGAAGEAAPESVMRFVDCLSVAVRDLYGETSRVTGSGEGRHHINGVVAFSNCGEVSVEEVWLRCGSAVSRRGVACISVGSDITRANATTGAGSVRIRGCLLHVGEMQVGLQLSHQARASVEDNEVVVDPAVRATSLPARLADLGYLAIARSYLISGTSLISPTGDVAPPADTRPPARRRQRAAEGAAGPAAATEQISADILAAPIASLAKSPVHIVVGNQPLWFLASAGLQSAWEMYLRTNAPAVLASQVDAIRFLKTQAKRILLTPAARAGVAAFSGILHTLHQHRPLAGRGIVVGGRAIGSLAIVGNSVSGVLMGVSVGVSHRASAAEGKNKQRAPDQMGTIRIAGNTIACGANDVASRRARFGIFVGSANSLEIESNRLSTSPVGIPSAPPADAVRVVGYLGRKAVIRHNHTSGFALGIRVVPLTGNGPGTRAPSASEASYLTPLREGPLWLVADNVIEGASRAEPRGPFTSTKNPPPPAPYIDAPACLRVDNVFS